jgi:hypothetical protein
MASSRKNSELRSIQREEGKVFFVWHGRRWYLRPRVNLAHIGLAVGDRVDIFTGQIGDALVGLGLRCPAKALQLSLDAYFVESKRTIGGENGVTKSVAETARTAHREAKTDAEVHALAVANPGFVRVDCEVDVYTFKDPPSGDEFVRDLSRIGRHTIEKELADGRFVVLIPWSHKSVNKPAEPNTV